MNDFIKLHDLPYYQQAMFPKADCLNEKINGTWRSYSTGEVIQNMNRASRALLASGITKGNVISIVGNNRPEWNFADFGGMQIGALIVPIYPTISDEEYLYILNNAATKILFVSTEELYQRMKSLQPHVDSLKEIITFNEVAGATHWNKFLERGDSIAQNKVDEARDTVKEEDVACMIYTSGTTGFPKGVMLSHLNVVSNMKSASPVLPINETHRALSFLPLNHVFEKMVVYCYFMKGVSVYYAESLETIGENLREVKPNFFTCVPRLLEKVYERIMSKGLELKGIKRALFFWAVSLGEKWKNQKEMGTWYHMQLGLARKLIFSKWIDALGGKVFAICSGSAPLNAKIGSVFTAAGIVIMEGYGLTESSPVITVNHYDTRKNILGTVGLPVEGVEVKIQEDGEILARGKNIMVGYYNLPDETAKTVDADGWLHTGDIGEWVSSKLVPDKFLKITDRKKELLKTSGGKYVAPQPIENSFKESFLIEQMMVVGDARKFVSALIVPSFQHLKSWCEQHEIPYTSAADMIRHEKVVKRYNELVEEKNKKLGHTEQIKRYRLIAEEWTVPGGQLTPTMKLKRKVIMERYKNVIDEIYAE